MKKIGLFLSVGALALCLAACGKDAQENISSQGTEQTDESGSVEESAGTEGANNAEGTDGAAESGDAEDAGNVGTDGWSVEMEELRAAVLEAVGEENYWPDMPMTPDIFEMFYSVTPDMYEDYLAETPMISANVDALVIVKAKEDQTDAVEDALNAYRDMMVSDTMQYPANLGKIQASQVERIGDYVIFVQLGGGAIDAATEEDVLRQCQEANELALNAIRERIGND